MKIFLSIVLVLIALFALFFEVDKSAMELYYQSFDRAVYSFALAKGLNAVISVIQSSEINVSFFVGATVGLGEILDPLNDMVERFSWIMLASSVSIGIQHLLLLLGKTLFLKTVLIIGLVITFLLIWVKKIHNSFAFILSLKIVVLLLVLRFGAVTFVYVNEAFYNNLYAENYANSTKFISSYKNDLEEIQKDKEELNGYWEKFERKMEVFSKKVIKLITMFVVTTIIFPLVYLWFLILLVRWTFNLKFDSDKIMIMLNKKGF
ncbi:hypothetical protein [Sulfurimonas sp.]|uniref:hypothetical protein n=1 Tax=Sulfurimonas sp. TaxID=2022749 RepID=UPI003563018B